jgi:hypothetical protein
MQKHEIGAKLKVMIRRYCRFSFRHPGLEPGSIHQPLGAAEEWIPARGREDGRVVAERGVLV